MVPVALLCVMSGTAMPCHAVLKPGWDLPYTMPYQVAPCCVMGLYVWLAGWVDSRFGCWAVAWLSVWMGGWLEGGHCLPVHAIRANPPLTEPCRSTPCYDQARPTCHAGSCHAMSWVCTLAGFMGRLLAGSLGNSGVLFPAGHGPCSRLPAALLCVMSGFAMPCHALLKTGRNLLYTMPYWVAPGCAMGRYKGLDEWAELRLGRWAVAWR